MTTEIKKLVLARLQKLNETSVKIFRDFDNKRVLILFYNGCPIEATYSNEVVWNGLIYPISDFIK